MTNPRVEKMAEAIDVPYNAVADAEAALQALTNDDLLGELLARKALVSGVWVEEPHRDNADYIRWADWTDGYYSQDGDTVYRRTDDALPS